MSQATPTYSRRMISIEPIQMRCDSSDSRLNDLLCSQEMSLLTPGLCAFVTAQSAARPRQHDGTPCARCVRQIRRGAHFLTCSQQHDAAYVADAIVIVVGLSSSRGEVSTATSCSKSIATPRRAGQPLLASTAANNCLAPRARAQSANGGVVNAAPSGASCTTAWRGSEVGGRSAKRLRSDEASVGLVHSVGRVGFWHLFAGSGESFRTILAATSTPAHACVKLMRAWLVL
jgi:hypothetical protein